MVYAAAGIGVLIGTPVANAIDDWPGRFLGSRLLTGSTMAAALPFAVHSGIGVGRMKTVQAMQRRHMVEMMERGEGKVRTGGSRIEDTFNRFIGKSTPMIWSPHGSPLAGDQFAYTVGLMPRHCMLDV